MRWVGLFLLLCLVAGSHAFSVSWGSYYNSDFTCAWPSALVNFTLVPGKQFILDSSIMAIEVDSNSNMSFKCIGNSTLPCKPKPDYVAVPVCCPIQQNVNTGVCLVLYMGYQIKHNSCYMEVLCI